MTPDRKDGGKHLNGRRRGFRDAFLQILVNLMIEGLFDRIFIEWYWVGKMKAWIIPGTEELMPYIQRKALAKKWIGTLVGFPVLAILLAYAVTLLDRMI